MTIKRPVPFVWMVGLGCSSTLRSTSKQAMAFPMCSLSKMCDGPFFLYEFTFNRHGTQVGKATFCS